MDASVLLVPEERGHPRNVEGLPPDALNVILQHFFAEIDKKRWQTL